MNYKVKNWKQFQHFKDRTPPWIKLYRGLLDDPDFHALDGDTAKQLVMIWLVASEDETHQGLLPCEKKLAFRLRISEKQLKQTLTKLSHWLIQDDINVISDGYQLDAPETERETETDVRERKKSVDVKRETTIPDGFFISDSVREWADKNGYHSLEEHLSNFIDSCLAKGYKYRDWDAAFRNAIKGNWAKIQSPKSSQQDFMQRMGFA